MIPQIEFREVSLRDAVAYLVAVSSKKEEDSINIIILRDPKDLRLTLKLKNVSLSDTLDTIAKMADLKIEYQKYAVVLSGKKQDPDP